MDKKIKAFTYRLTQNTHDESYNIKRDTYNLSCMMSGSKFEYCSSYCPFFNISGVESKCVVISCCYKELIFHIENPEIINGSWKVEGEK